tara:strand:- start:676 stop:1305 length:630 start_codon:yes stop_codon:yes gene_type:complete
MNAIRKYFPNINISEKQIKQFLELDDIYRYWNARVNLISRKDINRLYTNHILHSLSIAKIIQFKSRTEIVDVGTGGGFPGIPLAILFPKAHFTLIDSKIKKAKIVQEISKSINLKNVVVKNDRIERENKKYDFVISRAVVKMPIFINWVKKNIKEKDDNDLANGILYLKGGDLSDELKGIENHQFDISEMFTEDFFKTKKVVYINMQKK